VTRPASRAPAPPAGGQVCTLFAVDIAEFTRPDRDDDVRMFMREELYRILERAFDGSGIPWTACFREDRGDGALVVIPPGIAAKGIIDPLPERLRSLIRRHNHVSSAAAHIQLRVAAHLGPVDHDGHGFVGTDVDFLFRLLDARPLKRTLASTRADLALIVSDYVYRNIVSRHPSLVSPAAFWLVRFKVKSTRARAWTYIPSAPPSLGFQAGGAALTVRARDAGFCASGGCPAPAHPGGRRARYQACGFPRCTSATARIAGTVRRPAP